MNAAHQFDQISNSYAAQSYQRQRQLTLGDLLLENRIVFLQGEIYTGNANEACRCVDLAFGDAEINAAHQ